MRSPVLPPMRMNAAETSASRAIAPCTPLAVVSRSWTTAEIDTFIRDVSKTRTNIAMARRMARRPLNFTASGLPSVMRSLNHTATGRVAIATQFAPSRRQRSSGRLGSESGGASSGSSSTGSIGRRGRHTTSSVARRHARAVAQRDDGSRRARREDPGAGAAVELGAHALLEIAHPQVQLAHAVLELEDAGDRGKADALRRHAGDLAELLDVAQRVAPGAALGAARGRRGRGGRTAGASADASPTAPRRRRSRRSGRPRRSRGSQPCRLTSRRP